MKILVTGAAGQLGRAVCFCLAKRGVPFRGVDTADFDLTDEAATLSALRAYRPDAVVHCAAYTAVDKAEAEKDLCWRVNVSGTEHIVTACREAGAPMMYISTEYVFDGSGTQPFETDAAIAPLNHYGLTKAMGEEAVRAGLAEYFILRLSWVFGQGKNFVETMLRLGAQNPQVRVVSDQVGSPTFTQDVAPLIADMLETDRYGTYHATNEGYCNWFEFAGEIMRGAGLDCRVEPILSAEYPAAARRPMNSRLSKKSLDEAGFSRLPPWQDALARYLAGRVEK